MKCIQEMTVGEYAGLTAAERQEAARTISSCAFAGLEALALYLDLDDECGTYFLHECPPVGAA